MGFALVCFVILIPTSPFFKVAGLKLKIDEIAFILFSPYLFLKATKMKRSIDSRPLRWLGLLTFWFVFRASLNLAYGNTFRDLNPALVILLINFGVVFLANYLNQKPDAWHYVYIGLLGGLILVIMICACQLFGSKAFDLWLMENYTNEYISWSKFSAWGRVSGPFENESNYLAAYLAVVIAYLGGKWLIKPDNRKLNITVLLLCAMTLLVITSGRTAQLALVLGLLALVFLSRQPFKLFIPAFAVILALWITKEMGYYNFLLKRWSLLSIGLQEESIANRLIRWSEALTYLQSSWVRIFFGMGTRVDYNNSSLIMDSAYIDMYWSYGLVGLFLFLGCTISIWRRVEKTREVESKLSFITMAIVFLLCGITAPYLLSRRIYPLILLLYFMTIGKRNEKRMRNTFPQ
ncbi:MAG: hypothetical protein AB1847_18570 [bacterium]